MQLVIAESSMLALYPNARGGITRYFATIIQLTVEVLGRFQTQEAQAEPQLTVRAGSYSASTSCSFASHSRRGYFNVVPVRVQANGKEICSYAFLHMGSDSTFCAKKVVNMLGITGILIRITLNTLRHRQGIYDGPSVGFTITSLDGTASFDVTNAVTVDNIPVHPNGDLTEDDLTSMPNLKGLNFPVLDKATANVFIGNDWIKVQKILDKREGSGNQAQTIRTPLVGR